MALILPPLCFLYYSSYRGNLLINSKVTKMARSLLLLSNVIDGDHQNSCLFTNKGHFSLHLLGLMGVLAKFQKKYSTNSSN